MYYLVTNLRNRLPEYEVEYEYVEEDGKKYCIIDIEDEKGDLITKLKLKVITVMEVSKLKEIEERIVKYITEIKMIESTVE